MQGPEWRMTGFRAVGRGNRTNGEGSFIFLVQDSHGFILRGDMVKGQEKTHQGLEVTCVKGSSSREEDWAGEQGNGGLYTGKLQVYAASRQAPIHPSLGRQSVPEWAPWGQPDLGPKVPLLLGILNAMGAQDRMVYGKIELE